MTQPKAHSAARLKEIYRRQANPGWDMDYEPSIRATAKEAPSISRAYVLKPEKLGGREVHLLSTPELKAALIGFYHPAVVGLQEQRILSPEPAIHPLWTMADIDRTRLPQLRGVIEVAEQLDYLHFLPRVLVEHPDESSKKMPVVFPWIGDLLWAVRAESNHLYCVNWSVKDKKEAFFRPTQKGDAGFARRGSAGELLARHEIEQTYYEDAQIRTIQVTEDSIDKHVAANLRALFLHHGRPLDLEEGDQEEILHRFKSAFDARISPSEVIISFLERGRFTAEQCKSLLYQAIWKRRIRADLFTPILINKPLRHETKDLVDVYADWFREWQ